MRLALTALFVALALPVSAKAEKTAQEYLDSTATEKVYGDLYVVAAFRSLEWANLLLDSRKQPRLYCRPDDVEMTPELVVAIYRGYLKRNIESDNAKRRSVRTDPMSMTVLMAAAAEYPCPKT